MTNGTNHTVKTIRNHKVVEVKVFIPENDRTGYDAICELQEVKARLALVTKRWEAAGRRTSVRELIQLQHRVIHLNFEIETGRRHPFSQES